MSCYVPVQDLTNTLKQAYRLNFEKYKELSAIIESVFALDMEPEAKIHAIWFYAGYVNAAALKESRLQTQDYKNGVYERIHNYLEPFITAKESFDYDAIQKAITEFFPSKEIEIEEQSIQDQISEAIGDIPRLAEDQVSIETGRIIRMIMDNRGALETSIAELDAQNSAVIDYLKQLRDALASRTVQPVTAINQVNRQIAERERAASDVIAYINMREADGIGTYNGRPMYILRQKNGAVFEVYYDKDIQGYRYYNPGNALHEAQVVVQPATDQIYQFYNKKNLEKTNNEGTKLRLQLDEIATGLVISDKVNVDDNKTPVHQRVSDSLPTDQAFYSIIRISATKYNQQVNANRKSRMLMMFPDIRRTIETTERPNQVINLSNPNAGPILSFGRLSEDDFTITVSNHDNSLSFDIEPMANLTLVYPDNTTELIDVTRPDHLEYLRKGLQYKQGKDYVPITEDKLNELVTAIKNYNEFKAEVLEALGSQNVTDIREIFFKYYDLTNSVKSSEFRDVNEKDQLLQDYVNAMNGRLPVRIQQYNNEGNKVGEPTQIKIPIIVRKERGIWKIEDNVLPENARLIDESGKEYFSVTEYSKNITKDDAGNPTDIITYIQESPFSKTRQALYLSFSPSTRNPNVLVPVLEPLVYQKQVGDAYDLVNLFATMMHAFSNASFTKDTTTLSNWTNNFWGFDPTTKLGIKPDIVILEEAGGIKKFGIKLKMLPSPVKNTPEQVEAFNTYFGRKDKALTFDPTVLSIINKIVDDIFKQTGLSIPDNATMMEMSDFAKKAAQQLGSDNVLVNNLKEKYRDLSMLLKQQYEDLMRQFDADVRDGKVDGSIIDDVAKQFSVFDNDTLKLYNRQAKVQPLSSYYKLKTDSVKSLTLTLRNPLKPIILPTFRKSVPAIDMSPVAVPVEKEVIDTPGSIEPAPITGEEIIVEGNDPFKLIQSLESYITLSPEEFRKEIDTMRALLPKAFKFTDKGFDNLNVDGDALGFMRGLFIHLNNTLRAKGVAYHEGFHGVFRNILSTNDQKYFLKRAEKVLGGYKEDANGKYISVNGKKVYADNFRRERRYVHLNDEQIKYLIYEEYLADSFADFMESDKAPKTWMERLFAYLKMLLNFFKKHGEIENLFYDISLGKYKNAQVVERPSNVETLYKMKDYKGIPAIIIDANTNKLTYNHRTIDPYIVTELANRMVAEMAALKASYPESKLDFLYEKAKEQVLKEYNIDLLTNQRPDLKSQIETAYGYHYDSAKWLLGQFHDTETPFKFLNFTQNSLFDDKVIDKGQYPRIPEVSKNTADEFKKGVIADYNSVKVELEEIEDTADKESGSEFDQEDTGESFNETSFVSAAPGEGSAEFRKMFKYVTYEYNDPRFGITRKRTVNSKTIFNTIRKITANLDKTDIVSRIEEEIENLSTEIDNYNEKILPLLGIQYAIPPDLARTIDLRDSLQAVYNTLVANTGIEEGFPTKNIHVFIQFVNTFSTIDARLQQVQLTTKEEKQEDKTKKVVTQEYKLTDIVVGNSLNGIRQNLRDSIYRIDTSTPEQVAKVTADLESLRNIAAQFSPQNINVLKDRFLTANQKFNDAEFQNYVNSLYVAIAKLNIDIPYFVVNTVMAAQVYKLFYEDAASRNVVLTPNTFYQEGSIYRSMLAGNRSFLPQFRNLEYSFWSNTLYNAVKAKIDLAANTVDTVQFDTQVRRLSEPYISSVGEFMLKYDPTIAESVTKNANGDKVHKYVKPTPAYVLIQKLQSQDNIDQGLLNFIEDYYPDFLDYFKDNPFFDLSKPENRIFLENLTVSAFAGFVQNRYVDNVFTEKNEPSTFKSIDDKAYALSMLGMFVNRVESAIPGSAQKLITYKRIITQYEATSTSLVIDSRYKRYIDKAAKAIINPATGAPVFVDDLLSVVKQEYNLIKKNFQEEADTTKRGKLYKDYNTPTGKRRGFNFNIFRDFFNVDNIASADPNDNRSQRTGLRDSLIEEAKKGTPWEQLVSTNPDMMVLLADQMRKYGNEQYTIFEKKIRELGIENTDLPTGAGYNNQFTDVQARELLADMFFNNWINGIQVNQIFDGPIAVGIKNYADFFKRQKAGAAAGENIYNPFRSFLGRSKTYRAAVMKEIVMYIDANDLTKPMRNIPYDGPGEQNKEIKPFDGQSVNTIDRRIKIAESQGQLDYQALEHLKKMRYLMESSDEYSKAILDLRKRNIYFNSLKTVSAAGFQYIKQSEHTILRKDVSMLAPGLKPKTAYQELDELYRQADTYASFLEIGLNNRMEDPETGEIASTEELYMGVMNRIHSYFVPMKGRETLHVLLNSMEIGRIEQLMDPNASKRATVQPVDINQIDLESGEGYVDLTAALEEVPTDLTYIQLETGGISDAVTQGIQQKLLIIAQLDPNNPALKNIKKDIEQYRNNLSSAVQAESAKLMRILNASDAAVVGKIYTAIADGLREQGTSANILQFFELNPDGTPIYNPSIPIISNVIVYYYFSIFNNSVFGKKISGNKYYHVSPYGYQIIETANGDIVTHDEYKKNPSRYKNTKTRYPSIVKEEYEEKDPKTGKVEKKVRYVAEVIVPKELKEVDQKFLERYLSEFFATRIPTEGRRSMIVAKVVDYIDEAYGTSIIVPYQLHMLAGSDFDIDALYAHVKSSYYGPDGARILYGSYAHYKSKYGMSEDEGKFMEYLFYMTKDSMIKPLISEEMRRMESEADYKAEMAVTFGNLFGGKIKSYFEQNASLLTEKETEENAEYIDVFKKVIATYNVIDRLKQSGIPTTPAELKSYVSKTGTNPVVPVTLNEIVQNKINILSDPAVYQSSMADPTNTADAAAEIYKAYVERRGMSETEIYNRQNIYTPTALIVARALNSESKDSLGIAASFNKGVSMLATIEAVLKKPVGTIYDQTDATRERAINTDKIVADSVKLVGGAIGLFADAPKNPYPGPLNLTDVTTPVMTAMFAIGVPQGAAIMFQSLPIIKRTLDKYKQTYGSSYKTSGTKKKNVKTHISDTIAELQAASLDELMEYDILVFEEGARLPKVNKKAYKLVWTDNISPDTAEEIQSGAVPISNFGFRVTDKKGVDLPREIQDYILLTEFSDYMALANEISFKITKLTDVLKSLRPDQEVFDRLLNTFKEVKERPGDLLFSEESLDKLWKAYPVLDAAYAVLKNMDDISKKVMIERTSLMKGLLTLLNSNYELDAAEIKNDLKAFLLLQMQNVMMAEAPKGLMADLYLEQLTAEGFLNGNVVADYLALRAKYPENAFLQSITTVSVGKNRRVLELNIKESDDVLFASLMALLTDTPDVKMKAFRIAYHGMIKSGLQRGKGSFYQLIPAALSKPMSNLMNELQARLVELDNVIMKKHKKVQIDEDGSYEMTAEATMEYTQKLNEIVSQSFGGMKLDELITDAISKIISMRAINVNQIGFRSKSVVNLDYVNRLIGQGEPMSPQEMVDAVKQIFGSYAANIITDQGIRPQLPLNPAFFVYGNNVDLFVPTGNKLEIDLSVAKATESKTMYLLKSVGIMSTAKDSFVFPLYKFNMYGQLMILKTLDGKSLGASFIDTLAQTEFSGNSRRLDLVGKKAVYEVATKQGANKISPLAFTENEGATLYNMVNGLQQTSSERVDLLPSNLIINRAANKMYFFYPVGSKTLPPAYKGKLFAALDNSKIRIANVDGKYQFFNGKLYMTNQPKVSPTVQDEAVMLKFAESLNAANFEELKSRPELADFFAGKSFVYIYNLDNGDFTAPDAQPVTPIPTPTAPTTSITPTIDLTREWKGDLESRPVYTKEGVNTMRTSNAKPNEHFGNPFSEAGYGGTIKVDTIQQAVINYKEWLLGTKFTDVKPEQRAWILNQINQGKLDGATLLYAGKSAARGQGMHPTALVEVVEQLRSLGVAPAQSTVTPTTGFQGYKFGFENKGKGTVLGDGKDKAMRKLADGFIGELASEAELPKKSPYDLRSIDTKTSTGFSFKTIGVRDGYSQDYYHKGPTVSSGKLVTTDDMAKVVMLARNGELKGKPLAATTKESILNAHEDGAEFVVGDMPGVDSQFIDYLQEIGAKFTIYHTGPEGSSRIKVSQPTAATVKGIEIGSNTRGLGAALTNPTELAKKKGNIKNSYPVYFTWLNKDYEAQDANFEDVEQAYQKLKDPDEAKTQPSRETSKNYKLMVDLITAKLEQYPILVQEITKQGGSPWILASTHQPTTKNTVWETGGKNWFILALNDAYVSVAKVDTSEKEIDDVINQKKDESKGCNQ